jgi:CRP/FNR family transcriptional regulator
MNRDTAGYKYYFDALKESAHFSALSDEILHEILSMFYVETWSKGEASYHGEKTYYKTYFIVSGRIRMFQINPENGHEHTLFINTAGDLFDLICLIDGKRHDIEMEALDEITLLAAPIDVVRGWIDKHPSFNRTLLPYIAEQFREMESKATELALFDTWTRTLRLFIKHTQGDLHKTELKLINGLPHSEIAKIIGTSKNVINRHIQRLKDENILHVNRKNIEITNLQALISKLKIK